MTPDTPNPKPTGFILEDQKGPWGALGRPKDLRKSWVVGPPYMGCPWRIPDPEFRVQGVPKPQKYVK